MANFFRRIFGASSPGDPPPNWAAFFTSRQYQAFMNLVGKYFHDKGLRFSLQEGVVRVGNEGEAEQRQLGLLNLAQKCHLNEERHWPRIIADHFQTVERSQREGEALEERLEDFDKVAELLAVRLWPTGYRDEMDDDHLIYREDLPGVLSVLVYDLPSTIRNVAPKESEAWERTHEELFGIALENVREICIPDVLTKDVGDDIALTCLVDESFYVASHALLMEHHPDCLGPYGALVGIPHRHVLLAYPIADIGVVKAINKMIPLVYGLEKEGPGSITSSLYWYREGEFTELPYQVAAKQVIFSPPDEFARLLGELAEPDGEDEDA